MQYRNKGTAAEIHAKAVASMSQAIAIWDQLEVPNLVGPGLTELSRFQLTFGDVDAAVATDRRLIDYWHTHGNAQQEGWAYVELATRLQAGKRNAEALAGWEQTIAFARANRLDDVHASALSGKAIWLKVLDRNLEAEAAEQIASKAMAELLRSMPQHPDEAEARMPDRWLDVPTAPVFAELLTLDGRLRLVLTNRSKKSIGTVYLGCVAENGGKWIPGRLLFSTSMNHGGVRPEGHLDVTRTFAGTRNWWTDRPMGCEDGRPTAVEVQFADGTKWRL